MVVLLRFGYDINKDKHYIINEQEAPIIRLIFDMYINNHTYKEICSELNLRGYKTKKNREFGLNSIHDILVNEKYKGTYFFGYGSKSKKRGQPLETMIKKENAFPAIIDSQTFDLVQLKMKGRKHMGGTYKAKQVYLLSGLIKCGNCGSTYAGAKKNLYWSVYECTGHKKGNCDNKAIKKEEIENIVITELKKKLNSVINDTKLLEKVNEKYKELYDNVETDLEITNKKLATVNSKINNINKAIVDGLYSPELKQQMNELQNEKNILEQEANMIKSVSARKKLSIEDVNKIIIEDLLNLDSSNPETVKNTIHKYVTEIIITPNNINLKIAFGDSNIAKGDIRGGGEESRTPVQQIFHINFSECSLFLDFLIK